MDTRIYIGLIEFIVLLFSLSIHECAHAWTSDRLGDPTARYLGRVSLNPIVHADPFGTILIPIMGIFFTGFLIGWAKPVPVNVGRLRNPTRDHMIVAAAGPLSNLMVAAILFAFLMVLKSASADGPQMIYSAYSSNFTSSSALVPLTAIAYHGVMLNVLLAVFNLIPVAPLDGAAVVSGFLPRSLAPAFDQIQSYGFMVLLLLLYLGIPGMLYYPVQDFLLSYLIA
jgi:Zn-dependent protease